ncbi:MAG: Omp28-related outer membrane protein [Saprospiraceae bacterium]|nr:Omp28-related outer membrane protein [Saprospiraceae bacterium]MBK9631673.1 Omp28-related outer membrane protein [Saprospiraceae bacterium]
MNKKLLFFLFSLSFGFAMAQETFSDDMESYNAGDLVGQSSPKWTCWSGAAGEGGQEDASITDENAKSGTKSLKLESFSATGGPTDVLLPFAQEYNIGTFNFEMHIFVVPDQGAYFNFQGKATAGQIWCFQGYFDGDSKFRADMGAGAGGGQFLETDYTPGEWLKFNLKADLTNNLWEVFLNDVSVSKFSNINNSIASLNLYPTFRAPANGCTFYIDDVSYSYVPYTRTNLEATLLNSNYKPRFLAGESSGGSVLIRNIGLSPITSLELTTKVGNGTPETNTFSNLNIAPLASTTLNLAKIVYAPGANDLDVTISKVNGQNDDDQANNTKISSITGVVPAQHKVVVAEEATGTWCQWCPRGAVFMDSMDRTYHKYFAGIAVHGGSATEPMRIPVYDAGLTSFPGFQGFPSVIFDRGIIIDPSDLETSFYDNIVVETPVILTNGATWNPTTGDLVVSVKADFIKDLSGDYRFNMVLVENGVKGNTSAYNQSNAYSGGANGKMGGYEILPNPVPASRMTYNHVARIIMDGFDGLSGYLPNVLSSGTTHYITYTTNLPIAWKEANIEIIGMVYGPAGEVVNATKTSIAEAVANGLFVSTENPTEALSPMKITPNPAAENSQVELELSTPSQVRLEILDLTGKVIQSRNYGQLEGSVVLPIQTLGMNNGVYTIRVNLDGEAQTKKLVVSH